MIFPHHSSKDIGVHAFRFFGPFPDFNKITTLQGFRAFGGNGLESNQRGIKYRAMIEKRNALSFIASSIIQAYIPICNAQESSS